MSTHPKFTPVICIGVGLSGICLGAQLKIKYGLDFADVHFYDRNAGYSGTWWVNRYPGEFFIVGGNVACLCVQS
jgi:cation diffusion facilitator CzcD-associated flavoprotein CzcO